MARAPRRTAPPPYIHQEYPKMIWHPETGENRTVNAAHEVPEGWLPHHPNDPNFVPAEPQPPPKPSVDRGMLITQLRRRGINFSPRASTKELEELLG